MEGGIEGTLIKFHMESNRNNEDLVHDTIDSF